jgi:V8-like Glu-specific endopeptidase
VSGHPLLQGLLLSLLLGGIAVGQSAESAPPSTIQFAPLDLEAIAAEDGERDAFGFAPRFAIPQEVSLTPGNSGVWSKVDERLASWQLRISCENAISFNFGFIRWSLPYGAEMRILNAAGTQKIRPFDIYDVQEHGELWTPAIGGNGAIIQINCLHEDRWIVESAVMLGFVNIGYRGFHAKEAAGGGASPFMSGSCNVDVACPQSAGWENEIDCVGVISTGGSTFCTGFMVNNTNQDGTPYFMTADHCGITSGNAASLVVYWNYENSFCRTPGSAASGGPGDGVLNQFSTGSIFRAGSGVSDFTLVELNAPPNPAFGVSFCGWNNGAIPTTGAVGIHHPNTDEKRISFEDQPVVLSGNYVDVTDWDLGTTEPGSSGSPLFDMNHRVIGQLCCGAAACGNNLGDSYGWFGTSWGLGLSGWLDPTGSGATVLDTLPAGGGGPVELCSNGIDDDGDSLVDCNDPDCATSPACLPPEPGDECAIALIATLGSNPIDTTLMTPSTDPFNNAQCASTFLGAMHNDVWYALTAPNSGDLSVSTCGTVNFDTDIVVYSGACGALVQIGCNGDGPSASCPGFSSDLSGVPVTAGATYYIRIGGYDGSSLGTGTVDITVTGGPGPGPENCTNGVDDDGDGAVDCADPDCAGNPACGGGGVPGDECANALVATLGPNPIDNFGASTSVTPVTGCTGGFGDMANDLWWTFTAGSSGVHTVSTCGTVSFDTDLEVYAGPCGALSPVGCSGDTAGCAGFTSVAEFNATAGVTYRIRIGGWSPTEIGSGTFDISTSAPPVPENCTNGVDDDGDGAVDCADPDCASDPICAPPPALLWTFSVPGATVGFPQGSGVAAFSTSISIEEASTNTNFPNETQGFSLGLENDPALLTATALDLAPALAGLDGGNGPAFLSLDLYANGVTAGVIYDFFGLISLNFAGSTEVLTVDYSTVAGSLAGSPNAVTTSLTFSDSIGAPAVETVMVVDGANYGPAYSNAVISLEPQPFLFTFLAPALTVDYPAATGVTSFTAPFSIEEDPANNGFPNATQGFSMGIAHDASLLDATAITPLPALAALDSGSGPAFLDLDLYSTGVTVGVVYDFFGVETLSFSSATEVIEVGYTTQGGTLAGAIDPTVTSILWSNSIGSPPVESVLVVAASSVTPSYSNGSITLVPGVGGFRRMDCNVDGSTDIADAIAALSALFSGGTVTCDDACDVNDDGSFDIADAIAALSVLFSGAPNPPAPYGDCGADPTSDTLECDTYNAC